VLQTKSADGLAAFPIGDSGFGRSVHCALYRSGDLQHELRLVILNQLEDSRLKLVEYAHTGVIADRRAYVGKWLGSGTTPIGAIRRRCGRRSQHLKQIVIVQVAASIIASRDEGA
jgi:hypothetical protein